MPFQLDYFSLIFSLVLTSHGWRKRSLSTSGAIGAFFIAYVLMAVPLRVFGASCIALYLVGSRATKVGKEIKARLEIDHKEAGERNVWQAISNTFSALIASILWSGLYVPGSMWASVVPENLHSQQGFPLDLSKQCPLDRYTGYSRYLIYVTLGHFACCLGDTLASELGILSKSRPILITTLRPVPPGTNGALSTIGTAVSFIGGGIIGLTIAAVLLVQSPPCRQDTWGLVYDLLKWGFIAGGIGSILDSIMGATIQKTRYSKKLNMVLQDDSLARPEDEVTVVSGVGILTNGQINLISSAMSAVIIATLATSWVRADRIILLEPYEFQGGDSDGTS